MSILYLSCYLLSLLPLRLLYFISDLLYLVIYYAAGYRRKVVAENLAGGLANKTAQERNEIAKAFYHHLCDLLLEHIKALTIKRNVLLQRVTIDKIEIIRRFYERGQSIILVSGHFGNWEWVANGLALQTSYAICAGYQPLRNKGIDQIVRRIRSRFRRKALPITSLLRHIKGYTGPPQAITLLIDQAPLYKGSSYATTFLGQPTNVALTAAKVARKLNQPLFYIEIERIKRGTYQARPILLTEAPGELSVEEIAKRYTRRLEEDILRNPAFWLWSHKRWKDCKLDKNA